MFFLLILNVWTMGRLVSTRMHQGKRSISVWRYIIQDGALGKVGIFVIFLNRTVRHCNQFVKCHILPYIFYFVFLLLFVQKVLVCMVFLNVFSTALFVCL